MQPRFFSEWFPLHHRHDIRLLGHCLQHVRSGHHHLQQKQWRRSDGGNMVCEPLFDRYDHRIREQRHHRTSDPRHRNADCNCGFGEQLFPCVRHQRRSNTDLFAGPVISSRTQEWNHSKHLGYVWFHFTFVEPSGRFRYSNHSHQHCCCIAHRIHLVVPVAERWHEHQRRNRRELHDCFGYIVQFVHSERGRFMDRWCAYSD